MSRIRNFALTLGVFAAGSALGLVWQQRTGMAAVTVENVATASKSTAFVAAAGRVEPVSEEISIGSELDGRLQRVLVEEGQRVARGQVVAELVNGDYAARVVLAKAAVAQREAVLERLRNGSRKEDRRQVSAEVREAEAVLDHANRERERRQMLLDRGAISRVEYDAVDREYRVAQARLEAVKERCAAVEDETRPEDLRRADAEVASVKAQLQEAEALLAKTIIRSPMNGVVLRKKLKTGESVASNGGAIVTLGDTSALRVRVDVDENDVARIREGQMAWVTAPAYGAKKFTGKVVEIGQILGRKNVRSDEPTERLDVKILETLVELDAGQRLPVGLRVDAYIETEAAQ